MWKRLDRFESFEDVALLPNAGFLGNVRRVGANSSESNCELVIHSQGVENSVGVKLELIATKQIGAGDVLKLNMPPGGTKREVEELEKELKLTGMPHYAGLYSTNARDEL